MAYPLRRIWELPRRSVFYVAATRLADGVIGGVAGTAAYLAPPERAYAIVWAVLSPCFPLMEWIYRAVAKRPGEHCRTMTMQRALAVMTRCRPGFDLPLCIEGRGDLIRILNDGGPIILCTAHFGLTLAAPRILADCGRQVALIAGQTRGSNGWHWGLREPLQILGDRADAFLKARSALKSGNILICYVDYAKWRKESADKVIFISRNVFRLAHLTNASVMFYCSRLEHDGHITIHFHLPLSYHPISVKEADHCAAEFADFASGEAGWNCIVER
jgi:lauroyl/myristoyl acyltransferase